MLLVGLVYTLWLESYLGGDIYVVDRRVSGLSHPTEGREIYVTPLWMLSVRRHYSRHDEMNRP